MDQKTPSFVWGTWENTAMQRKQRDRDGLVPVGEALAGLGGAVKSFRKASPQARHHFTRFDQVNQYRGVSAATSAPGIPQIPTQDRSRNATGAGAASDRGQLLHA